ncbi:MAG: DUF1801 domain-containing protein [Bacteroidota bacterium]|jgi:hypothetical protein|nr:DUF1801 domain-containing protein [Bacteroidota bacterium]
MAEIKTKVNDASVEAFLASVENAQRREDSFVVLELMKKITKEEPKMWGTSIVGFGTYHYKYASGQEGDWPVAGFSPRKQALTVYLMTGFERDEDLMAKLGKYKTGVSCLYIKKLEDVDMNVLAELIKRSLAPFKKKK